MRKIPVGEDNLHCPSGLQYCYSPGLGENNMKFGGNSPSVSEENLFNNIIFYFINKYTAQGQGKITLAEKNFDCNLKLLLLQLYIIVLDTSAIFVFVCVFIALKVFIFARM